MKNIFTRFLVATLSILFIGQLNVSALTMVADPVPYSVTDTDPEPVTNSCVNLTYNMSFGSKDSRTNGEVSDLQFYLQDAGYLTTEPTGNFGNATKRAVQAFQRANGITPNGSAGPFTRAKIKALTCGGTIVTLPPVPVTSPVTGNCAFTQYWDGTACKEGSECLAVMGSNCVANPCASGYVHTVNTRNCIVGPVTQYPATPANCTLNQFWDGTACKQVVNCTSIVGALCDTTPCAPGYVHLEGKRTCVLGSSINNTSGVITLDSPTCAIPAGQSQCGAKISWSVTNPVAGKTEFVIAGGFNYTMYLDSYPSTNFMNGKGENVSTYTLKNNGVTLDTKTVTSKCATGSSWNGSVCATGATPTTGTPSVKLLSPNGGESWVVGTTYTINYSVANSVISSANPALVYVEKNGTMWRICKVDTTAGSCSYTVEQPMLSYFNGATSGFTIKVCAGSSCAVNDLSDGTISIKSSTTATPALPTASLTISAAGYGTNVRDITYPVGTANTKNWTSTNGTSYSSVAWRTGSCTNRTNGDATEVWQANTASGVSNGIGNAGDVGCVVHIKYTVTNAAGSVSDQVNVTVTGSATTPSNTGSLLITPSAYSATYVQGTPLPSTLSGPSNYTETVFFKSGLIKNTSNTNVNFTISVPNQPAWLNSGYVKESIPLPAGAEGGIAAYLDPATVAATPGEYRTNIIFSGNFVGSPTAIPVTLSVVKPPLPTASLTISAAGYGTNVRDITYPVGTANTKNWTSTNGTSYSSVAWRTGSCTNRTNGDATEVWQANTASGVSNGIGNAGDVGCVVHIKYTVTNAAGSVSDQVNVTVTGSVTTPSGSITLDSEVCTIPVGQVQCGSKISWNVINPVAGKTEFIISGGFNYTMNQDSYPTTTFMNGRGVNTSTYTLKNNGVVLDTRTVTSKCVSGSLWTGSVCQLVSALPTASLTISAAGYGTNVRDITYPVGTANTKNWTSTNGTSYSSVAWRTGSCTNRTNGDATEVWQANTASGVSNGIGNAGDVGCVVHIKYTVTNAAGSNSSLISVTVTSAGGSPGGAAGTTPVDSNWTNQSSIPSDSLVLGASTMCVNLTRNFHRGDESQSTVNLQTFLHEQGFLKDSPTGFYGDKTVEAVKAYQKSRSLKETGMVYDLTRETIRTETCGI